MVCLGSPGNPGVSTDRCTDSACGLCGFNPSVRAERGLRIRSGEMVRLKNGLYCLMVPTNTMMPALDLDRAETKSAATWERERTKEMVAKQIESFVDSQKIKTVLKLPENTGYMDLRKFLKRMLQNAGYNSLVYAELEDGDYYLVRRML